MVLSKTACMLWKWEFVCDSIRDCMHVTRVWGLSSFVIAITEGTIATIQGNAVCFFGCHIRSIMLIMFTTAL